MKGDWAESQAGCTTWEDVSKETFERFAQFAYTGDYSIPKTEKRKRTAEKKKEAVTNISTLYAFNGIRRGDRAENIVEQYHGLMEPTYEDVPPVPELIPGDEPETEMSYDAWRSLALKNNKKKKGKTKVVCEFALDYPSESVLFTKRDKYPGHRSPVYSADFHSLSFPLLAPRNHYEKTCDPVEEFDRDQDYSNVFLSHASLYVLGDFRLIDSLKALALFKLHKTLCSFQLDEEHARDIVDLARYAYSEEGGGDASDKEFGGLRGLVCHYMATNAVVLSRSEEFMEFLDNGGQFVKDFFKFEVQRAN